MVARLAKYAELNVSFVYPFRIALMNKPMKNARLLFRFLFVVPLMILGIEGLRNHGHTVRLQFWKDLLAMLAGIGVVVSSAITILVRVS